MAKNKNIKYYILLLALIFVLSSVFFISKSSKAINSEESINLVLLHDLYPEIKNSHNPTKLNQKTPRNLFINFYLKSIYMWCGYNRVYFDLVNCISENKKSGSIIYSDNTYINLQILWKRLLESDFNFNDIPTSISGSSASISLGNSWNKKIFYIAKNKSNNWFFTNENFTAQTNDLNDSKFNDELLVDETNAKNKSILPIIAYMNFVLGYQQVLGFNINSSLDTLSLSWVPKIARKEYGTFLSYMINKILYSRGVSVSSIPGQTSSNNNTIVLYVSEEANCSIFLKKEYSHGKFKWVFPREAEENAVSIYENEGIKYSSKDPAWFIVHSFLYSKFPILKNEVAGIPYCFIIVFITSIFLGIFIFKFIRYFLSKCLKLLNSYSGNNSANSKFFSTSTGLLATLIILNYIIKTFIIFHFNIFIIYVYVFKIVFDTLFIWWLCTVVDMLSSMMKNYFYKQYSESFNYRFIVEIITRLLNIAIIIIFAGLNLQSLGFNMLNYLTALGIGGIAVALAGKDTIENLFGSLMIALEKPFSFGDWVKIDNIEGYVVKVGLRSTRIKTFEDSYTTVPNVKFITSIVDNMGARAIRRYSHTFKLALSTEPEQLTNLVSVITEYIKSNNNTTDSYYVYINDIDEISIKLMLWVDFKAYTWKDELSMKEDLITNLLTITEELGIEFAYPSETLYLEESINL